MPPSETPGRGAALTITPAPRPATQTPHEGDGGAVKRAAGGPAPRDSWSLIDRAQAGDMDAFGDLYERYSESVFRFIYFRTGHRQTAEDLTADTFARALKRIGSITWMGVDPGAWLVTIARNLIVDYYKSARHRLEIVSGEIRGAADRVDTGPEANPDRTVVDYITNLTLLAAVNDLNPEQRECIVLRFLRGLSVAETARVMGKNEGAIKALQWRAINSLRRVLPRESVEAA